MDANLVLSWMEHGGGKALYDELYARVLHLNVTGYAKLRNKPGTRSLKTPREVLRARLKAWNALVARGSLDNPYFERVLNSQRAWARRTVGWALDTIVDPRIACDHWFVSTPAAAKK